MMSLIFLVTAVVCLYSGVYGHVPVVSWSNTDILSSLTSVSAGHTVYLPSLQEEYLDVILSKHPQNIVVFVHDKLSVEDFTLYGDVYNGDNNQNTFQHLKDSLESAKSSLVLPSVNVGNDRNDLVEYLKSHIDGQIVSSLQDVNLDKKKSNLIIKHMPNSDEYLVKEMLSESDRILGEINKELSSTDSPYTMILTADRTSKVVSEKNLNLVHRLRRETGDETHNTSNSFLNGTGCVFMYAEEMEFNVSDTAKKTSYTVNLIDFTPKVESNCDETNRSFHVEYVVEDYFNLTISMKMNNDGKMWTTDEYIIKYVYHNDSTGAKYASDGLKLDASYITAPMSRSYHCDDPPEDKDNVTAYIDYTNFQFQPFNISDSVFSDADDCIGIFTPEIWMSLLAVLLFTFIMAFGLVMLLNLTTMDRFDDPKGKHLSITTDD